MRVRRGTCWSIGILFEDVMTSKTSAKQELKRNIKVELSLNLEVQWHAAAVAGRLWFKVHAPCNGREDRGIDLMYSLE